MINKEKINTIVMKPKAICFCPLGNDWYTNEFTATMTVGDEYPDYCHIERFLNEEIRGKNLIIEQAVNLLYEHIMENYHPVNLEVRSDVNDVTSHSPVTVIKN